MTADLADIGVWDLVLYLGVLYHIEDPMAALRRVGAVTGRRAVIETEAVVVPGYEHEALWRFFPGAELNGDVSNWWAPNMAALVGALAPAGFTRHGGRARSVGRVAGAARRSPPLPGGRPRSEVTPACSPRL